MCYTTTAAWGKGNAFKASKVAWTVANQSTDVHLDIILGPMAIQQQFVLYFTRVAVFSVFDYTIGAWGKGNAFKASNVAWTVANELSTSPDIHLDTSVCPMAIQQQFVLYFTRVAVFSVFDYHRS